jgi:hypothetical protein
LGLTIFSFIIDDDPAFVYEGWHLARSLIEYCGRDPSAIVVQCTPEVSEDVRVIFRGLGCRVQQIARFGDGRHCNKLGQLDNLDAFEFDCAVLLDTDTIALSDIRPFLNDTAIGGKIVDAENPPLHTLEEIAAASGLQGLPPVCKTDTGTAKTFIANCNGGFYSVPKAFCERLSTEWRRWALWLLDNVEPLERVGKKQHVDQVSFWLAVQHAGLPFVIAPSNINYYVHLADGPSYFDNSRPVALLHYHVSSLDVLGLIRPRIDPNPTGEAAVAAANRLIGGGFDNRVFWEMRYRHFPERGSGVGSRGDNVHHKRELLIKHGIEKASSVLDIGCGDLEVVKALNISGYLGVDQSAQAIEIARRARPDWQFRLAPEPDVPPADMVLCMEVLIHQETEAAYRAMIAVLAEKTLGTLLVSGFQASSEAIQNNPMLFFYEPLEESLRRTGRFRSIVAIGTHTSVVVYRCDV